MSALRTQAQTKILFRRRYWLYYVLTFFEGSRMQVFGTFSTLILVQDYGLNARQISLLLVVSGIINFVLSPSLGKLLDVVGERVMLSASYVALALCFVGYATVHNVWFLGGHVDRHQPLGHVADRSVHLCTAHRATRGAGADAGCRGQRQPHYVCIDVLGRGHTLGSGWI